MAKSLEIAEDYREEESIFDEGKCIIGVGADGIRSELAKRGIKD